MKSQELQGSYLLPEYFDSFEDLSLKFLLASFWMLLDEIHNSQDALCLWKVKRE